MYGNPADSADQDVVEEGKAGPETDTTESATPGDAAVGEDDALDENAIDDEAPDSEADAEILEPIEEGDIDEAPSL